jgi:CBS domain-containing protein
MHAHEIMSRHVITVGANTPVTAAIRLMLSHHISGLPVIDTERRLIGILSESDFLRRVEIGTEKRRGRWLALLAGRDQVALDFVRQHGRKVSEMMSPDPITISEDTSLEQIVRLMESHNVKRLPVMRGEEIVGIVSRADFLAAIASRSLDVRRYSDDDNQMRRAVVAALSHASWRPCALNVSVHEGVAVLRGTVNSDNDRKATIVVAENVPGVKRVEDQLSQVSYPPPEEEYGGGDFVSLQAESSAADDEPL